MVTLLSVTNILTREDAILNQLGELFNAGGEFNDDRESGSGQGHAPFATQSGEEARRLLREKSLLQHTNGGLNLWIAFLVIDNGIEERVGRCDDHFFFALQCKLLELLAARDLERPLYLPLRLLAEARDKAGFDASLQDV